MFSGIQDHDVVVSEVVLTEVRTLLADREVTLLVRATEQSGMVHVGRVSVVGLLSAQPDPEEVVRLFSFVQNLNDKHLINNWSLLFCTQGSV